MTNISRRPEHRPPRRRSRRGNRRGSATVELAITLPFLLTLVFGVIEVGRALEVTHTLTIAVREGARFGATDKTGYVPEGGTANEKICDDIEAFLVASGLPDGSIDVQCLSVPEGGEPAVAFNFEDPANHLKNFQVIATVPYSAVTYCPGPMQKFFAPTEVLTATATFRNYRE